MVREKLKRAMFCATFLVLWCVNYSQGFTGGVVHIDTVIPNRNEAYVINETITVRDNVTLTVKPGVTMKFTENCSMIIRGALVANGTYSSQITFSGVSNATTSYSIKTLSQNTRLVDGNGFNTGRLEIFFNGVWGTVCDDGWNEVNTLVACRELGFDEGTFTNSFGSGTGQIWIDDVQCQHSHSALADCIHLGFGIHNCGHSEDVGLICSNVIIANYKDVTFVSNKYPWKGIEFTSKTQIQTLRSSLVYVNIYDVGQQHIPVSSTSMVAAIKCDGTCPAINNITISRCLKGVAIQTRSVSGFSGFHLSGVSIINCLYGIEISTIKHHIHEVTKINMSTPASYRIERIKIREGYKGIQIYNPQNTDFHLRDIAINNCSNGIEVKSSMFSEFTLRVAQIQYGIVGVRFESLPPTYRFTEKTDLCSSSVFNVTNTAVEVHFTSSGSWNPTSCSRKFIARTGHLVYVYIYTLSSSGTGSLTIIDERTRNFLINNAVNDWKPNNNIITSMGNEITVQVQQLIWTDIVLYIFSRPAILKKPEARIADVLLEFTKTGIVLIPMQNVFVSNTTLLQSDTGIFLRNGENFVITTLFSNCTIHNHSNNGICIRGGYLNVHILNCNYEGNREHCVDFYTSGEATLQLYQNRFTNNTGSVIVNVAATGSSNHMNISKNTWWNNSATAMVRLDKTDSSFGKRSWFTFNTLVNNNIFQKYPLLMEGNVYEAIIVHVRGQFNFQGNCLENPSALYEFATQVRDEKVTIDARFNWWGSQNPDTILSRIYDFYSRTDLTNVHFVPFLVSKDMKNEILNKSPTFEFFNNSKIGGHLVRDIVLSKAHSPYLVTRDVVIYPNATLFIEPGVKVNIIPHLGFDVYGKMEIAGEENDPIMFDVGYHGAGRVDQSEHPIRLIHGTKPWEGRIEILFNERWGTVCDNSWTRTNGDILCKQLGFQGYVGTIRLPRSSTKVQPFWLKNIKCILNIHSDITRCPFEGWNVTCHTKPLEIRCNPGFWRGIRFSDIAKPSQITYAKFKRGGRYYSERNEYNFVLQFDAQRQNVHDIEIREFEANGINIVIPNQAITFSNIIIKKNENYGGVGIRCKSYSLSIYNSSIEDINWRGIFFGTPWFLNDLPTQRISNIESIVVLIARKRVSRDICNFHDNETFIKEDSFLSLSIASRYSNSPCVHVLRILTTATIYVSSSSRYVTISYSNHNYPNATTVTLSSNDVVVVGPGIIHLWFERYYYETAKIYVLTSKGNESAHLVKGNAHFNRIKLNNCGTGIYVENAYSLLSQLAIKNSILRDNNYGVRISNSELRLSLKDSLLINNRKGFRCTGSYNDLTGKIQNCSFIDHSNWAIYLSCRTVNFTIAQSSFQRNTKVIFFSDNLRERYTRLRRTISVEHNKFVDNTVSGGNGVLDFKSFGASIIINNNEFRRNKCSFVSRIYMERAFRNSFFELVSNVVENNYGSPGHLQKTQRYAVGFFGCLNPNDLMNHNIFNNPQMDNELFIETDNYGYGAKNYYNRSLDARYNWWGTSETNEIENKIYGLDDWNYIPSVNYLPFATSRNFTNFSMVETSKSQNSSVLGGYINSSLKLTQENSPYFIKSDLTINWNSNLTIQPGVTLFIYPRVGLLIFGNIVAIGSTEKPIRFYSFAEMRDGKQNKVNKCGILHVRRRRRYLEIFVENSWKFVCGSHHFDTYSAQAACRELGFYGAHSSFTNEYIDRSYVWQKSFKCVKHESLLTECSVVNIYCNYRVQLVCNGEKRWGNIRITAPLSAFAGKDHSILQNVHMDGSGNLHGDKVSAVQIINRSPIINHLKITNGGIEGIQMVLPQRSISLKNVTVHGSCWSRGITILGNKENILVTNASISNTYYGGLVIASMESVSLDQPYYGLPSLCDCEPKFSVKNVSYIYMHKRLRRFPDNERSCSKAITSPENTAIIFKVLTWWSSSNSWGSSYINIYDGATPMSSRIAYIDYRNFEGQKSKKFYTSSNSLFIEAHYYYDASFLVELTVIHKKVNQDYHSRKDNIPEYKIVESQFYNNEGPAIQFTEQEETSSKLIITRNQITFSGRRGIGIKPSIQISGKNNDDIEVLNNFIHDNFQGGIHVHTDSSGLYCKILNNVISSNMNGSESILVQATDNASPSILIAGNELVLNNLNHSTDILAIKNFQATIIGNFFFENVMRYVLNWNTRSSGNKTGVCEKNMFSMNAGYLQTIVLRGSKKTIQRNYIVNPANLREIAVFPNYQVKNTTDQFDARFNWLGYMSQETLLKRITSSPSQFPVVAVKPFLISPMEMFSTVVCPTGWNLIGSICYYYHGGAMTLKEALQMCQNKGGMLMEDIRFDTRGQQAVKKILEMRTFSKSIVSNVWINVISDKVNQVNCWIWNGSSLINAGCNYLYPSICQINREVDCPNSCFHKGICKKRSCICNKGFESEDCSQYHCRDVGNCGRYGTCVGPNQCRCRLGWKGRGCTVSYCPPLTSCKSCLSRKGCGWCDEQGRCLPGTAYRSDVGQCKDWFFYQCLSVGNHPQCSSQVKVIDCKSRLCNYTFEESNQKTCQQCMELGECFNQRQHTHPSKPFCGTWNETRCPQGFVLKDYSDKSRINNIVVSKQLKVVTINQAVLYKCATEDASVIVLKKSRTSIWKKGQIISSSQAEGIFHRITKVANFENYQLLHATPASINEAISYSDFSQNVPLRQLAVQEELEDSPEEDLLTYFLLGGVSLSGSRIHTIGNDVIIYKCVGHHYSIYGQNENADTLFIAIPIHYLNFTSIKVGDVLVGNNSNGFLETITEMRKDRDKTFIHTELTRCADNLKIRKIINVDKKKSSCLGGDNLLGLQIIEETVNVNQGDVVVGRKSGSFLGKVLSKYNDRGYVFVEIAAVVAHENGNTEARFNFSSLDKNKRRRREIINRVKPTFNYALNKNMEVNGTSQLLNIKGRVFFKPDVKVTLEVSDSIIKKAGVAFSGVAELNVGVTYNLRPNSSVNPDPKNKKLILKLLRNKKIKEFSLYLQTSPVIVIPGQFLFNVQLSIELKSNMKAHGIISVDVSSSSNLNIGGTWRKGRGVESLFKTRATKLSNSSVTHLDKGWASLSAVLIPTFKIQWPTLGKSDKKFEPFSLNVSVNTPLKSYLQSTICSEKCQEPGKRNEINFHGVLPAMSGTFSLKLGNFKEEWPLLSKKNEVKLSSDCIPVANNTPCCGSVSSPGKVNPITKKCELFCNCSGIDPTTTMGVKLENGKCQCDECPTGSSNCQCRDNTISLSGGQCKSKRCPDGSRTQIRSRGKPECPCTCLDGSEREMTESGSCPCNCMCSDGSKDTIASDGSCPCICRCKGYETSTTGPSGCKCEEDRCPICQDNELAVWVNRKCLCQVKYNCGLPPVCVDGRKGPKCLQPDCGLCKGCFNGNGICTTDSSCASRCVCNWRWEGECCERRIPITRWGDPHLETLDGIAFDYFGIGEFWDCKSVANDFGMQTRFYAYKGASLVGAMALKTGSNVVTITTCWKCSSKELPKLRIDGNYQSISSGRRFMLANETVTLDVQNPGNATNANQTSLIVFAFQYKSGVTVSINVGYSPKMARQYINVQFTPTASFLRQTEGICGFMDDDASNDLTGPNGEKYNDPIVFTESWRISTTHQRSGMFGSWSWNSSNFHANDIMDPTYTDANHKPIYTLESLPKELVEKANETCIGLGLENTLLQNCIFDISVTNDTSFSEQQTLKLGCPNECSGKGLCNNATCSCLEGWSGGDCSVGICGNCSRGKCEGGFCQCEVGWEGAACDQQATCYDVDHCTSPIHGKCLTTNKCLCSSGYIGFNCSVKATCYNIKNCSSNGECVDIDTCKCDHGWNGTTCEGLSCEKLGYCSGNGKCVAFDVCECSIGWTGPSCAIFDCTEINHCSKNGQCVGPNSCNCFDGYQGINCNASLNCSSLGDCNQNGVCIPNKKLQSVCSCYLGYTGSNCSQYDCSDVKDCSGRGKCVQPNLCECNNGYEGESCLNFTCEKLNRCSGRGSCIGFDECSCNGNWSGKSCGVPDCTSLNNCSSNGTCIAPNKCECYSTYDGERCDREIQTNLNNPVFTKRIYNATVKENLPSGYHVLTVFANDSDHGRSGKVTYSLIDNSIASYFIINRNTGKISTIKIFDYETISQSFFRFSVIASDDGSPRRRSEVIVTVDIQDENDNCPVFKTIPTNYNIPLRSNPQFVIVTIDAEDADSAENGQVEYSIDKETNPDRFFEIGKDNGVLFVNKTLQSGKYSLTIVARDLGENPCLREVFLTIVVDAAILPTSSSVAATIESSPISSMISPDTGIIQTLAPTLTSTHSPTPTSTHTPTLTGTSVSSTISTSPTQTQISSCMLHTSTPATFQALKIDVRLINRNFDAKLNDPLNPAYQNLEKELLDALIPEFKKIQGFVTIFLLCFENGSVIAKLSVNFSTSSNRVDENLLRQAIINATDESGNIGKLRFDILFLETGFGKTTTAPKDTEGDRPLPVAIIAIIGGVTLLIIIAAVFGYFVYRKRKQDSKRIGHIAQENQAYDIGDPVELIDALSIKEPGVSTAQAEDSL